MALIWFLDEGGKGIFSPQAIRTIRSSSRDVDQCPDVWRGATRFDSGVRLDASIGVEVRDLFREGRIKVILHRVPNTPALIVRPTVQQVSPLNKDVKFPLDNLIPKTFHQFHYRKNRSALSPFSTKHQKKNSTNGNVQCAISPDRMVQSPGRSSAQCRNPNTNSESFCKFQI